MQSEDKRILISPLPSKKYYVYQFTNPLTGLPFYIGKGAGKRWKVHFYNNHIHKNRHLSSTINQILQNGKQVIVEILIETDNESLSLNTEMRMIAEHRTNGINLCNLTDGGESNHPSKEVRKVLSEKKKMLCATTEWKEKESKKMKLLWQSEEFRKNRVYHNQWTKNN